MKFFIFFILTFFLNNYCSMEYDEKLHRIRPMSIGQQIKLDTLQPITSLEQTKKALRELKIPQKTPKGADRLYNASPTQTLHASWQSSYYLSENFDELINQIKGPNVLTEFGSSKMPLCMLSRKTQKKIWTEIADNDPEKLKESIVYMLLNILQTEKLIKQEENDFSFEKLCGIIFEKIEYYKDQAEKDRDQAEKDKIQAQIKFTQEHLEKIKEKNKKKYSLFGMTITGIGFLISTTILLTKSFTCS